MNKLLLLITSVFIYTISHSQTKMVIDRIQCTSSYSNVFSYLNNTEIKSKVLEAIRNNAALLWNASINTNEAIYAFDIKRKEVGNFSRTKMNASFDKSEVDKLHLFININESPSIVSPIFKAYKKQVGLPTEGNYSVITVEIAIIKNDGNIQLGLESNFIIQNQNPKAFGYRNMNYSMSPTSLIEFFNQSSKILLDTTTEMKNIHLVSCTQAYHTDNFIMPNIVGKKRTIAEVRKDFASFTTIDSAKNILRFGDMKLYLMELSKKKNPTPNYVELAALEHKRSHARYKYCNMVQEFRNVLDNKNYSTHVAIALNDDDYYQTILKFLPGKLHYFLSDKDTIATFSISETTALGNKKINLDSVYNGIDPDVKFAVNDNKMPTEPLLYNLDIEGTMNKKPFRILYGDEFSLKEIFYNNQLVCIAKGEKLLESFILIDANLSKDLLHQLLMLAFIKL